MGFSKTILVKEGTLRYILRKGACVLYIRDEVKRGDIHSVRSQGLVDNMCNSVKIQQCLHKILLGHEKVDTKDFLQDNEDV